MVTQTQSSLKLSLREKEAVQRFLAAVRSLYEEKIQRAALFGSKVRRNSKKYSDVDILLIVTDDDWKFRKAVNNISSDIELKYDVLLDVRVISAARWQYYAEIQSGLYQNISKDAVPIWVSKKRTNTLSRAG